MFFKDRYGNLHAVSRIVKVHAVSVGDEWAQIDLEGDDVAYARPYIWHKLRDTSAVVFPAAPGTNILLIDDEDGQVWRHAVLAWQMIGESEVLPVTVNGPRDGSLDDDDFVIEHPNGGISVAGVGEWDSLDRYRSYLLEQTTFA